MRPVANGARRLPSGQRLAVLTLVLTLFSAGPAEAGPLTEQAFSREVAEALRRRAPGLRVVVAEPLALAIGEGPGEARLTLDEMFQRYREDPERLPRILQSVGGVAAAFIAAPAFGPQDRGAIVPIVRPLGWLRAIYDARPASAPPLVADTLNSELSVVYAVDRGPAVGFLLESDLAAMGVAKRELRGLAAANLERRVTRIEIMKADPFLRIAAGGLYETSLLLHDAFWETTPLDVEGETIVALPARGVLLIGGAADPEHVAELGRRARAIAASSPYPVSGAVFVRRNGRFIPYF